MSSISSASSRTTVSMPVEVEAAARQVVDGAARGRDDDVHAAPQAAQLLADRLAAVDRQDPGPERAAVAMDRLGDLHRELAGRHEDERPGPAALPAGACRHSGARDPLEERQRERGRLAGPGRRLGEDVPAGEQRRDRLALDRRRLLVAEGRRGSARAPAPSPRTAKAAPSTASAGGSATRGSRSGGGESVMPRVWRLSPLPSTTATPRPPRRPRPRRCRGPGSGPARSDRPSAAAPGSSRCGRGS